MRNQGWLVGRGTRVQAVWESPTSIAYLEAFLHPCRPCVLGDVDRPLFLLSPLGPGCPFLPFLPTLHTWVLAATRQVHWQYFKDGNRNIMAGERGRDSL